MRAVIRRTSAGGRRAMPTHQLLGLGCVAVGALIACGCATLARCLVALVRALTDRPVPPRGHALARAGSHLLGLAYALFGVALLCELWWLLRPLSLLLIVALVALPVRLVRLSGARE
jgi:hypothetical protein